MAESVLGPLELIDEQPYGLRQQQREPQLFKALRRLTEHHIEHCPPYARIVDASFRGWEAAEAMEGLPFVPIGIFKQRDLKSFDGPAFKTLTSSGTTGGSVSQVFLDQETARRQTLALNRIMRQLLGTQRRPMLIIDNEAVVKDRSRFSARAAGIVGLMQFGRSHEFLLDDDMRVRPDVAERFITSAAGLRPLLFGFTYMVWKHLHLESSIDIDLDGATLVHSGGWKKLEGLRVDPDIFRQTLADRFGISEVINFYGMAEQVGSVFVEGTDGLLHPPSFADVVVRDPRTLRPAPVGSQGLIQVVSAVPTSYPGHSILTEDIGVVETVDNPATGHLGKAFRILGRVPKSELRGCSDTYAAAS